MSLSRFERNNGVRVAGTNQMSAPASQALWYLAREGQQYGPLSDVELAKFIELGHLQPTDLLWRDGFPDWRPAMVVFPDRTQAPPKPTAPPHKANPKSQPDARARTAVSQSRRSKEAGLVAAGRAQSHASSSEPAVAVASGEPDVPLDNQRVPSAKRAVVWLALLGLLGTLGWCVYRYKADVGALVTSLPRAIFDGGARKSMAASPFPPLAGSAEQMDAALQTAALWRVIKREFPDWYADRLKDTVKLAGENKDDGEKGQYLARALVGLRRQQVENALAASPPRLKAVASAFFDNLVQLRKHSVDACFGFISQGEANPAIVKLLQGSEHTAHLQVEMTAVFEAIAEGRKWPRVYTPPRKTDYDMLAVELKNIGWTPADLQLFTDEQALAHARPEKVCQLVHDWFAVQLSIKDVDVQMRLLVASLRPVVAG
jgi:GYF domain 2